LKLVDKNQDLKLKERQPIYLEYGCIKYKKPHKTLKDKTSKFYSLIFFF